MFVPHSFFALLSSIFIAVAYPACADCASTLADFDQAVAARALPEVKRLEALVSRDVDCVDNRKVLRAKRVALEITLAEDPAGPLSTDDERLEVLSDAIQGSDSWAAEQKLAALLLKKRQFAAAAEHYDASIEKSGEFANLNDAQKDDLLRQAAAAKLLASDDAEGTRTVSLQPSTRALGKLGGIYAPSLRGARPMAVPVPIQFKTGSADLTETGRKAADELLQALNDQNITTVTLAGHTDPRGGNDYNMQLSAARLQRVATYLGQQRRELTFKLVPKGKSDPFDVSVLPYHPSQEEVWALDRRVDWVR